MSSKGPRTSWSCDCGARVEVRGTATEASCAACSSSRELSPESLTADGGLRACSCCGHPELYSKKDFPRSAGIALVVVAAVLAPFTHYISLAVAAAVDFVLYLAMPEVVVCYVCGAEHRSFSADPRHPRYDREIEERLRYGTKAVMGKPMREGGTADAPEPEH